MSTAEPDGDPQPVVICVHGTFAAADNDAGSDWWQRDSKFRGWLQQALPEHDVEGEACIFHWTGENLESDRNTATDDLLKLLKKFEDTKTPYHLIGHSHGGSVIWELLKHSMRAPRHQLASLRSWTTVGSPFLQHYSSIPPPIRRIAQWVLNPLLWFSLLVNVIYLVPLAARGRSTDS
jgi:pimeloyl-ACP methyl ester carboxylesterase